MLVCLSLLCGFIVPVLDLFFLFLDRPPIRSILIRTLSCSKRKERYPIYIVHSDRQYRENRSRVLSALIGKNFRTLRGRRQLTPELVSKEIGLPIEILRQLESGTLEATPSLLVLISDYFGVLIDCLVYQDLSIEQ